MSFVTELKSKIELKLNKGLSSRIFLEKMRLIDEDSRKSSVYSDPRYLPFYGWLGTLINPKSLLEIGFNLGLCSGCFLQTCKSVTKFLAFQEYIENFSPKLGIANIKDNYKEDFYIHIGRIYDEIYDKQLIKNKWDLVLINYETGYDKYREYLDMVWENLSNDGLIFVDNISKHKFAFDAYKDFCKIKNRDFCKIDTRYGVGVIQK